MPQAIGTGKGDGSVDNIGIMSNSMMGINDVSESAWVAAEKSLTPDQKMVFQVIYGCCCSGEELLVLVGTGCL